MFPPKPVVGHEQAIQLRRRQSDAAVTDGDRYPSVGGGLDAVARLTDDVAREIRTGRLPAASITAASMRTKICTRLEIVVAKNCPNLVIDLRTFNTYALAAAAAPIKLKGSGATRDIDTTGFDVKAGGAKTRNMLRVFYRWPVMTDLLRLSMSNLHRRETLLFATATWRNEPF